MGVRFEKFELGKLFDIENNWIYGKNKKWVTRFETPTKNSLPVISGVTINNGENYYTEDNYNSDEVFEDCLTISTRGEYSGTVFYHDGKFLLANNILAMPMGNLSKNCKLYLAACINKLNYGGYSGYPKKDTLKNDILYLPIVMNGNSPEIDTTHKYHKDGYIPDFEYMERYIAELEQERIAELEQERIAELEQYLIATGLNDYTLTDEDKAVLSLIESRWGNEITDSKDVGTVRFEEFEVNKLFKLQKISHKVDKLQLSDDYEYPAYSSDTRNNGILGYAKVPEFICDEVNRVYLIFGDHTRTMNIARESFAVLDNVKVLIPCIDSDEAILYMCTLWKKCIQDLGYSRHWKIAKDCKLRLPITQEKDPDCKYHKDGYIPDFVFMERYIKAMEKVVIADVVKYKDVVIAQTKALVNA